MPPRPLGGRGKLLLLASLVLAALTSGLLASASAPAAPSCLGRRATIVSGAAKIVGGKAPDTIVVQGAGKHTVLGMGGNDRICGGEGEDMIVNPVFQPDGERAGLDGF